MYEQSWSVRGGAEAGQELPMDLPPHHNADHGALVICIWASRGLKRYIRERETLPAQLSKAVERMEGEEMFTELVDVTDKPERRKWKENL